MIEAPEALYLCEQLNKTVKGKRITNVFTLFTPHKFAWFSGSPDEYAEWLTGKSIDHARSQGGMDGIRSTDLTVLFGLSNGAIISRKRILGSKALDRQESTKVITSIIRLL